MHEFHHGLGHVQHGCKNEVVLPLSLALCNIFVLRAMSSFHNLSFQSQLGSLLFSLLLQVITLCLCQACAPAIARGAPLAVRVCLVSMSCPFAFGKPVRPPWNARGAPLAVRVCLVSIMSLCLWQARAPAVERPRCAFGCLCLPCHCLHVMSLCLWQARAPAVERPRCAFGCLSLFLAFMSCFCLAILTYML